MSDTVRNTKPLIEREQLFQGIIEMGLQIVVLGVMEPDSKFKHPDVIYVDELGPISDDIQIHIIHGAVGLIGSPSGVTNLTYCTDTPTLYMDVPFPFSNCYPRSTIKALLKKLIHKGKIVTLAKYYEYDQKELAWQDLFDAKGKPSSPLNRENIELQCNSDEAVIYAFKELLIDTYGPDRFKKVKINQSKGKINVEDMEKDKDKINYLLQSMPKKGQFYRYFAPNNLSTANWLRNDLQNNILI